MRDTGSNYFEFCKDSRAYHQVINVFIGYCANDSLLDVLEKDADARLAFEEYMGRLVKAIGEDDKRLGEPGFSPDIAWYVEHTDTQPEDFAEAVFKPLRELIKSEAEYLNSVEYAEDMYGENYLAYQQDSWEDAEENVDKVFNAGYTHGFKSAEDMLKAVMAIDNAEIKGWESDGYGTYGYEEEDAESDDGTIDVGAVFTGNGEEEDQIEELDNPPIDLDVMGKYARLDDDATIKGDYIYVCTENMVVAYVKVADVIAKGKELGLVKE